MTLGECIRFYRIKEHRTLKEVAHASGYSISFIADIEHGRRYPRYTNIDKINKIRKYLKIPKWRIAQLAQREFYIPKKDRELFCKNKKRNVIILDLIKDLSEEQFDVIMHSVTYCINHFKD